LRKNHPNTKRTSWTVVPGRPIRVRLFSSAEGGSDRPTLEDDAFSLPSLNLNVTFTPHNSEAISFTSIIYYSHIEQCDRQQQSSWLRLLSLEKCRLQSLSIGGILLGQTQTPME
jgi:hypothetical protein